MDLISAISGLGTFIVAIVGVCIAIAQIRSSNRDAHASRAAEMAWQVYETYIDTKIRTARDAAECIAHTEPVPKSAADYGKQYAQRGIKERMEDEHYDSQMRRLLRFYNQIGILIDKSLVDDDLVFALIGPGLKSGWLAVRVAVEWYQNYYEGSSGIEKAEARPIYIHVQKLYERYLEWEGSHNHTT
ncbi:MAG TPA: hypothetical protein VGO96_06340 [Pyrinomonadaceae bacterium]|jgi:hypothetical protein|nr:hypothetical protein [Pyrinomonadaceae bacterium]